MFVQLEVARLLQGLLIAADSDMYYAEKDIRPTVQTSTLNEELGQVRTRSPRWVPRLARCLRALTTGFGVWRPSAPSGAAADQPHLFRQDGHADAKQDDLPQLHRRR